MANKNKHLPLLAALAAGALLLLAATRSDHAPRAPAIAIAGAAHQEHRQLKGFFKKKKKKKPKKPKKKKPKKPKKTTKKKKKARLAPLDARLLNFTAVGDQLDCSPSGHWFAQHAPTAPACAGVCKKADRKAGRFVWVAAAEPDQRNCKCALGTCETRHNAWSSVYEYVLGASLAHAPPPELEAGPPPPPEDAGPPVEFVEIADGRACRPGGPWLGLDHPSARACAETCRRSDPAARGFVWHQRGDGNCQCVAAGCGMADDPQATVYQYALTDGGPLPPPEGGGEPKSRLADPRTVELRAPPVGPAGGPLGRV